MASAVPDKQIGRDHSHVCTKYANDSSAEKTRDDVLLAEKISMDVQNLMTIIKKDCLSNDGLNVNYAKIRKSKNLKVYKEIVASLPRIRPDCLNNDQKTAFFINLYNALLIHTLAELDTLPMSVRDLKQFWRKTLCNIGGLQYSLDDIQHGVLRANCPLPSSSTALFTISDPRVRISLPSLDPRVHFTLTSGAKSGPALVVCSGKTLESDLDTATRTYCARDVSMFTEVSEIWLAILFQWYRMDFGFTDVDVIRWVIPYLSKKTQDRAELLLRQLDNVGNVDIKYTPYDWRINSV